MGLCYMCEEVKATELYYTRQFCKKCICENEHYINVIANYKINMKILEEAI